MKTITKILMVGTILMLMPVSKTHAQTYEWKKAPLPGEEVIESINSTFYGGVMYRHNGRGTEKKGYIEYSPRKLTDEQLYKKLQDSLGNVYGESYPSFMVRNFKVKIVVAENPNYHGKYWDTYTYHYNLQAFVVLPRSVYYYLQTAVEKALSEVRESSRIAIDQIKVVSGMDREEYQDQVVEILLDKGYKVVAKEYLEKLYEEQKNQQSGIYNEKTTVQENNFSAVGYYLNVKLTETSLRVQVINVSTGEYAGNATVKLQ